MCVRACACIRVCVCARASAWRQEVGAVNGINTHACRYRCGCGRLCSLAQALAGCGLRAAGVVGNGILSQRDGIYEMHGGTALALANHALDTTRQVLVLH